MYKVFIENRPVIFSVAEVDQQAKKKGKPVNFERDVLTIVRNAAEDEEIMIPLKNADEFHQIFTDFKKIIAAGGLVKRKQRILFIKRNGLWDIPKGKVEKKESIEEAAIREVEEECGLKGVVLRDLLMKTFHTYQFNGDWVLKETHWYAMDYSGSKETIPQEEEGITKVKWFKFKKLDKVLENTYPSICEVIRSYQTQLI